MTDYIDRQAAIDGLCDNCNNVKAVCAHYPCKQYIAIEQLPTIEAEPVCEFWDRESHFCALHRPAAEPVKRGKWKPFDLTFGRSVWACTACNEATEVPTCNGKPMYAYCPHCGAKMLNEKEGAEE